MTQRRKHKNEPGRRRREAEEKEENDKVGKERRRRKKKKKRQNCPRQKNVNPNKQQFSKPVPLHLAYTRPRPCSRECHCISDD